MVGTQHSDAVETAWSSFCSAFTVDAEVGDECGEQRFNDITDVADNALADRSATTLAGVGGKLRRVFIATNTDRWAERLAIGEDTPENRHQLELADIYTRMLWGAIEDVERMAAHSAESQTGFDEAHAEYKRLKAIENGVARCDSIAEEELQRPSYEACIAETDAAFDKMIVIPVTDGPRVWAKFAAILDHYAVGGFGLDGGVQAQVFAEAEAALTRECRP
jgi:hypothetical protein